MAQGGALQLDYAGGPSGVTIGSLGSFDNNGMNVLLKFCSVASMQREYKEEMAWLSFTPSALSLAYPEIKCIRKFLQSSPHDPNRTVASLDGFVDFKSLSTLVGERFINNFCHQFLFEKSLTFGK